MKKTLSYKILFSTFSTGMLPEKRAKQFIKDFGDVMVKMGDNPMCEVYDGGKMIDSGRLSDIFNGEYRCVKQ